MPYKALTISTILASLVILMIAAYFVWRPSYLGENPAMYMDCARMLLSGQKQYVDFIDLNPPLATYLACLPVIVAGLLHLPVVGTFYAMMLAMVALSCTATARLCWLLNRTIEDDALILMPLAVALANVPLLFCFGERDHLIALAIVPFFFLRMLSYQSVPAAQDSNQSASRWERIVIGLAMGLALALKPQCGLIPLLTEVNFIVVNKRVKISADLITLFLVLAVYGLHFLLLPPAVRDQFFNWLLPLLTQHYNTFNVPFLRAAALYTYFGPLIRSCYIFAAIMTLAFFGRKKSPVLGPAICFAGGAYLIYLIQAKGWGYQTIHVIFACYLLSAALIPIFAKKLLSILRPSKSISQPLVVFFEAVLLIAIGPVFALDSTITGKELNDCDPWIEKYTKPGDTVLIISSAASPAYPSLFLHDRRSGSRYLWSAPLFMLDQAGSRSPERDETIAKQEQAVLEHLEQDIHNRKPKLVMIEYFQPIGKRSMLEILCRHGIVQQDLSGYKKLGKCNRFAGFLYTGDPSAPFAGQYANLIGKGAQPQKSTADEDREEKAKMDRMELFRRATGDIARADRNILIKPSAAEYCKRARAYKSIYMYQQAESDFESASRLEEKAETLVELGYCLLRSGDYPDAQRYLERSLELKRLPAAYIGLARVFLLQKHYNNCLEEIKLADTVRSKNHQERPASEVGKTRQPIDPDTAPLEAVEAALSLARGDLLEAKRKARLAVQSEPESAWGYLQEAQNAGADMHYNQMLPLAEAAIARDYSLTEAHWARAEALTGLRSEEASVERAIAASLGSKE